MSAFINRRRLLGTIERHRDLWQYEDSLLAVNRSMAFRHTEYSNITAELFSQSFFAIRWNTQGGIARWCYSHYEGKMFRNLTSMVRLLVKGIPSRSRVRPRMQYSTGAIPMELAFDEMTLQYILTTTLTSGEGTPGAFGIGWMNNLSVPDSVIETVEGQVDRAMGVQQETDPLDVSEEMLGAVEDNEILQTALKDPEEDEGITLPVPNGPVRIIRA